MAKIRDEYGDPITDINLTIPSNQFEGVKAVNKFGRCTNADSGVSTDVWDGSNATDNQPVWVAPTQARVHAIVSTSASDDGDPVGVGARTIRVYGLVAWDTKEVSEDITLNGTGSVNTVNSYVIIHRMKVLTKGATAVNVGVISATAATDGTLTAQINALEGQTQMAIYGIPSIQSAYMTQFYGSANKSGGAANVYADLQLCYNPEPDVEEINFLVKNTQALSFSGTSRLSHSFRPYNRLQGPGILKINTNGTAVNLDISAGFDLILVDD